MGDQAKTRLFVFLLAFWTLTTIFTSIFEDDLNSQKVTNFGTECLAPDSNCPLISLDRENKIVSIVNSVLNKFLDAASNIPISGALVPLYRMMLLRYNSMLPNLIGIILDMTLIYTVIIIYGLIREG